MKDVLYEVRCLKSNEDKILAIAGQFKQLSHEPEKFWFTSSVHYLKRTFSFFGIIIVIFSFTLSVQH